MNRNITANSFRDLSLSGKFFRILSEPAKAYRESLYKILSVIGQRSYTPFVILTRDRTGSNMLVQYLNSHPSIRCDYEVLCTLDGRSGPALVESIYGKQPFNIKAKGFKIFYYHPSDADQLSVAETWSALQSIPNLHLIHLRRLNLLETAVSSKIAYESGVYGDLRKVPKSLSKAIESVEIKTTIYPIEKLQAAFEKTRQWEDEYPNRFPNCPSLETTYEALVTQPQVELRKICTFLGCTEPFRLKTNFQKQRTKSLRSVVENYAELKEYFAESSWSEFFTE